MRGLTADELLALLTTNKLNVSPRSFVLSLYFTTGPVIMYHLKKMLISSPLHNVAYSFYSVLLNPILSILSYSILFDAAHNQCLSSKCIESWLSFQLCVADLIPLHSTS